MINYKGKMKKESSHTITPNKSSWDKEKEHAPFYRHEPRHEVKYESKYETRDEQRNEPDYEHRYESKYQKSQLSYYPSQSSRMRMDYDHSQRPSAKTNSYRGEDAHAFDKIIEVRINSEQRQSHTKQLRVQVLQKVEKGRSVHSILLIDENRPTFLWYFNISQSDFMILKNEQKLKIHFSQFSEYLIILFNEVSQQNAYREKKATKLLQLRTRRNGEGVLSFIESDRFRQSSQLELKFKQANDEYVKQFLASKLLQTQQELKKKTFQLSDLTDNLRMNQNEISRLETRLSQIQKEYNSKCQNLLQEQRKKTNEVIEKYNREAQKQRNQNRISLKNDKYKMQSQINQLTKIQDKLTLQLKESTQKVSELEFTKLTNERQIKRLEQQKQWNTTQVQKLRIQNKKLSETRQNNSIKISQLTSKIEALKSQVQDKKVIISSTVENKQSISSQISSLQEQNRDQKKHIIRLQKKITQLQDEVSRTTSKNTQQFEKIARQKQKLLERADIIKAQEKEKQQLQKIQITLKRQKQDLAYKNTDKDKRISDLEEQLRLTNQRLEQQNKLVNHLQKQMNQTSFRNTSYTSSHYSQLPAHSHITPSATSSTTQSYMGDRTQEGYTPTIRKYQGRQRSKSPIPNRRLTQQRQPQEEERIQNTSKFDQPRPVRFKLSQPRQQDR